MLIPSLKAIGDKESPLTKTLLPLKTSKNVIIVMIHTAKQQLYVFLRIVCYKYINILWEVWKISDTMYETCI